MSWFKSHFGLDVVDTTIHAAVTVCGMVMVMSLFGNPWDTVIGFKVIAVSLVAFAWRRNRALKQMALRGELGLSSGQMAAERLADMEERLGELEAAQARVAELEERLDFTERMLAAGQRDALPVRAGDHG
jgi:hypothetical protein